jgi:type II secretory pathway component PulK
MRRNGFALITVLWLVTALAAVVSLAMAATRLGNQTTTNRLVLARGRWAAEACLAIAQARWVQHRLADSATIDLGRGTHCAWSIRDPSAAINLNTADADVLSAAGCADTFVQALVERRREQPLDDVGEATILPGFDSTLLGMMTVQGPGAVNLGAAPRPVLLALPGLEPEAADRILYRRSVGRSFTSLDALAGDLSPPARAELMSHYADLARLATFSAPQLVVRAEGWVEGYRPRATIDETVVPLPERLAVVGRRMW